MTQIDWGIAERGIERTRQQFEQNMNMAMQGMERHRTANALMNLRADPNNEKALRYLYGRPGGMEAVAKLQAASTDQEYRDALSAYMGGSDGGSAPSAFNGNALAQGALRPGAAASGVNALAMPPLGSTGDPQAPYTPQNQSPPAEAGTRAPPPATPGRQAHLARMARANPKGTMDFLKSEAENRKAQLEMYQELNEASLRLLGGVRDQAGYSRARLQAAQLYARYGFDPQEVLSSVPEQYSPENVRMLQMQGMETKDQLAHALNEDKFAWDVEDDVTDNAREDRNTDSMIGYRAGQLELGGERNAIAREGQRDRRDIADNTPVATTVNERGETVVQYRGGRTQTLRDSRDPRGQSGRGGRGGRGGSDLIGPAYKRGNVTVRYSKSKQGYVDVATGAVVQ